MAKFFIRTELPDAYKALKKLGVDKDGEVQDFVTKEVMRNIPDFMPRDTGALISGIAQRNTSSFNVVSPYARFLFFGRKRDGGQVDYSRQRNPQGGPNWDRRMQAERGAAIAAAATRYAKGR